MCCDNMTKTVVLVVLFVSGFVMVRQNSQIKDLKLRLHIQQSMSEVQDSLMEAKRLAAYEKGIDACVETVAKL